LMNICIHQMIMLHNITWQTFISTLLIITGIYYLVIIGVFYSGTIVRYLKGMERPSPENPVQPTGSENEVIPERSLEAGPFYQVSGFLNKLTQTCTLASLGQYDREKLIGSLKELTSPYKSFRSPIIQNQMNTLIMTLVKNTCSINLSDEELNKLWNG
jgi:hypothetical protein